LAHELLREEKELVFLNSAKTGDRTGLASGKIILTEIYNMLASGKPFVMESTISGNYHLRILSEAQNRGYEIILFYVFLDSVDLNIARIKNRVLLGGHNVPDADVIRRFSRSVKNFAEIAKIVDSWELYYNGGGYYEQIAKGSGDDIYILNDALYKRFQEGLMQ
jgi:predicted ABC-type ATPase